jgi:hypothetical protein
MPVRSVAFGTVALVGCCLLPPLGHPAHASAEQPRSTHHKRATQSAANADLPFFLPGLWQYRRTVVKDGVLDPRIAVLKKCADPSTEIRTKMTQLEGRSCQFAPLARQRNRYLARWTCATPLGPMNFRTVLITKGATSYVDLNEMRSAQSVTRQRIEAVRVGECPASGSSPMSPDVKPPPSPAPTIAQTPRAVTG